jgi:hypothetical protein
MSETPQTEDDAGGARRPSDGPSLRQALAAAPPSLLAALVEQFWEDHGHGTRRTTRNGREFVLVRDADGEPAHFVWIDPGATATPEHVQRLTRMASSFGSEDATLITGRDYGDDVYAAADEHGVECLADGQLVTFVNRAGLRGLVKRHVDDSQTNAVADGGATAGTDRTVELRPPADHPRTVRAGLVVGGALLTLLAVWGGAATVTARLQACTSDCTLLWGASFLPLLAMLVGSFAVAVGIFD